MNDRACLNCEKRYPGCHDTCFEYQSSRTERDRINDKVHRAREAELVQKGYVREHYEKRRKAKK